MKELDFKKVVEKIYYDNIGYDDKEFSETTLGSLFYKIFGEFPKIYRFYIDESGKLDFIKWETYYSEKIVYSEQHKIEIKSFDEAFKKSVQFRTSESFGHKKLYISNHPVIIRVYVGTHIREFEVYTTELYVLHDIKNILESKIISVEGKNIPKFRWVTASSDGFSSTAFKLKDNYNLDINSYYNDSLPYNDLLDFCNNSKCGLTLLHGSPGCGKTTLIKNLIHNVNKTFFMLDANMLANTTSSSFVDFLMDNEDSIFVLEDCEKLLADRNSTANPWIGVFLNLTDGMLGEGLGIKFICTFNADLSTIDKALLREGRLSICYELKPLCKEKAKVLCEKEGREFNDKDMTLAEIFKSKVSDSKLDKSIKRIGF